MKINKKIALILSLLLPFLFTSCKEKKESSTEGKLIIGASPTPHAEILNYIKPDLEKKGIQLEVKVFNDYILPNKALNQGELDANYYQHLPFLSKEIMEKGYKLASAGPVHLEPLGFYSKKIKKIEELKEGATIITSNSISDHGRIIAMLKDAGLVDVKPGADISKCTFDDIEKNPKNLKFNHTLDPQITAKAYENNEGDLIAINSNFAYSAGLNPLKDSVLVEKDNTPYVNVVATQRGHENDAKIKILMETLHEKRVQDFIIEKWSGSVKPVE